MKGVKVLTDKTGPILKAIRDLGIKELLVGIPEDKAARKDGDGYSNAQIGYIQENGSTVNNIPATPFLEPGVLNVKPEVLELLEIGIGETLMGDPGAMDKAMTKAGLLAVSSVRQVITSQEGFEPLSESTLAARRRKGFSGEKRLLRTGQLRNSINFVIRKK